MDLGPHAAFIWASYGVAVAVIAVLLGWIGWERRRLIRALELAEARPSGRRQTQDSTPGETENGETRHGG